MILTAPAKINLFLYVTGRRANGFHELSSLMVPVDLTDRLTLSFEGQGIQVYCDHPDVPEDSRNLVYKAADLFGQAYKKREGKAPFEGVCIDLEKTIPVGGGLGGGSSNAASVLSALNQRVGHVFSHQELMALGLELGADVPFFLLGKAAYAAGVGEILTPCPDLPDFFVLICCPGVASSTARVFKNLDYRLTLTPNYIKNTGSHVLPAGQKADHWEALHNDLEGPACGLYPEIGAAKEEMTSVLQQPVFMSGSGSSLFALFSDHGRARSGYTALCRTWSGSRKKVFLARAAHSDR